MAPLLEIRGLSNFFGNVCTARDLDLSFEEGVLTFADSNGKTFLKLFQ